MKKKLTILISLLFIAGGISAQDTMYVHQTGGSVTKVAVNKIDSIVFYASYTNATDIDGNVYNTVSIGTQTWMTGNLRTKRYKDGQVIALVKDDTSWAQLTTGGFCWYNNDSAASEKLYGKLYNWHAVNTGKLCPGGWHVPSDDEWTILGNYLIANGYNFDGTTVDNKIAKSLAAKTNWNNYTTAGSPGNDPASNNRSGFSGLPGGSRLHTGSFNNIGNTGYWWSSTEVATSNARSRYLNYTEIILGRDSRDKEDGFSVRCIRN
jgi:uncharacterized protein (TIGR02145 family)